MRAVLVALVLAALPAPAVADTEERPPLLRDVGLDPHLGARLPLDLPFRDEDGHDVTLGRYLNGRRPAVLSLVYFGCPMLCSQVSNALARTLKAVSLDVGRDYDVLTVSFDPRDGPEVARAKKADALERYGRADAAGGWHFLTGDAEAIRQLTAAVGFRYAWDDVGKQFAHVAVTTVVAPDGKIARYFPGLDHPPRDVRLALVEASAGRVGTTVDRMLLFCYRYDAATGRYTPVIESAVRVAGLLTVLALATLIAVLRWREPGRAG